MHIEALAPSFSLFNDSNSREKRAILSFIREQGLVALKGELDLTSIFGELLESDTNCLLHLLMSHSFARLALALNQLAMTFTCVAASLLVKQCIFFDTFALARVAGKTFGPCSFSRSIATGAKNLFCYLDFFGDSSLLHNFVKC